MIVLREVATRLGLAQAITARVATIAECEGRPQKYPLAALPRPRVEVAQARHPRRANGQRRAEGCQGLSHSYML